MIRTITNLLRRPFCDHDRHTCEEYEILLQQEQHTDDRGVYHPHFEGVECTCRDCGKTWYTDRESFRYYIDRDRNLTKKVNEVP